METSLRRVEKRNRPPVSCEPCRTRKLKCDRNQPCDSCIRRNKSCHYASNATRGPVKQSSSSTRKFVDRLDNLESVVSSFLEKGRNVSEVQSFICKSASEPKSDALTPETPRLQTADNGQVSYIDPSHWQSILEDIREVRDHLAPSNNITSNDRPTDVEDQTPEHDAAFVFGSRSDLNIEDILTALPPQPICDMMLSWFFGQSFMVLGVVHPAKFQKEYKSFLDSPSTTSPLWIALLFAVLSITASMRACANMTGSIDNTAPSPHVLQEACIQSLILGRYATANEFALEAFLLHLQSCFVSENGRPTIELWFEMGTICRLAFRMGYHRDPGTLPGISPFDAEMRRRLWLNIVQIDALMSFQMGFPSMIPSQFCDTAVPRNLEFSDLQPGMAALPPSRPFSERTPAMYTIVKSSIMGVFKRIVSHTQLPIVPSYDATLALEAEMRSSYASVPEIYQARDVNQSFMDPSGLILERGSVEVLYLKGLIVLLRRYVSYDLKASSVYEPSRQACVEAALDILARQADIYQACGPGGRLHEDRWMFAAISMYDYLLAAMVVCLHLSVHMRSGRITITNDSLAQQDLTERSRKALQKACKIWKSQSAVSKESKTAAEAIELMLHKVAEKDTSPSFDQTADISGTTVIPGDFELPYAGTISEMIDGNEVVDWSLLDQYLQGTDNFSFDFET